MRNRFNGDVPLVLLISRHDDERLARGANRRRNNEEISKTNGADLLKLFRNRHYLVAAAKQLLFNL